ncbi:MAG: hypothetical protein Q9228_001462 [Teloschistes exilis]
MPGNPDYSSFLKLDEQGLPVPDVEDATNRVFDKIEKMQKTKEEVNRKREEAQIQGEISSTKLAKIQVDEIHKLFRKFQYYMYSIDIDQEDLANEAYLNFLEECWLEVKDYTDSSGKWPELKLLVDVIQLKRDELLTQKALPGLGKFEDALKRAMMIGLGYNP